MSADAKVWIDDETGDWCGLHDGDCKPVPHVVGHTHGQRQPSHCFGPYDLTELLAEIEHCSGVRRWEFRIYPDGKAGLVGWSY